MKKVLFLFLILMLIGALVGRYLWIVRADSEKFAAAKEYFEKAMNEQDTLKKSQLLNKSLEYLLDISEISPARNAAAGAVLSQFREFSLASFYFYQAINDAPENEALRKQLREVIQAGDLPNNEKYMRKYQVPYVWMVGFVLLWTLGMSLYVMWPGSFSRFFAWVFSATLLGFFLIYAHQVYMTPIQAILVRGSPLYKEAGKNYPIVSPSPLQSGTMVTVLDVVHDGEWVKTITPDGVLGYVPQDSIRVLR